MFVTALQPTPSYLKLNAASFRSRGAADIALHPAIMQQLTVCRFSAPFESSSVFAALSNDSVQAEESFCPHLESPTCSTAQHGREPDLADTTIKPDPGQQDLQIDCRASQPLYYHSINQECQDSCQAGRPTALQEYRLPNVDGDSIDRHDSMVTLPQELTSSYDSPRRSELHHSPSMRPPSADKVCHAKNPTPPCPRPPQDGLDQCSGAQPVSGGTLRPSEISGATVPIRILRGRADKPGPCALCVAASCRNARHQRQNLHWVANPSF